MIYFNLDQAILDAVLADGDTGWLTISAAIAESDQGFPDTTFIEVRTHLHTPICAHTYTYRVPIVFAGSVAPGHALRRGLVAV